MSTTSKRILDIYQMSLDTGISEDDIRWNLDADRLVLVTGDTKTELVTARQARNAYHNLKWFFSNRRSGHSATESSALLSTLLNRWKELSLEELIKAEKKNEAVAIFNEAPPDVRRSKVAIFHLGKFY